MTVTFNPASIFQDPSYLAYRAALGLESSTAVARLRAAQDTARRQAALNVADVQQQGVDSRRNITGNMESRGLTFSGERLKNLARQRAAEGRQTAGIQANLGGYLSDLDYQVAQQQAGSAADIARRGLATADSSQLRAQGYY